jgi:hypothetical protein
MTGSEGRNFNDFPPKMDMRKTKTAPDKPTVIENFSDFLRRSIRGDIKILGMMSQ